MRRGIELCMQILQRVGVLMYFLLGLLSTPIVRGLDAALTERCMIFELPLMEATHFGLLEIKVVKEGGN